MSNLPLQPLVWQDLDEDPMLAPVSISESPLHHYVVLKDGEGIKVRYSKKGADFDYATGFATIDEAKAWAWKHYNEKMQPYVKPMITWISVDDRLPNELKTVLITYEAGLNFKLRKFMALALREGGDWLGIDDMFGGYVFDDEYNADKFNDDLHGFNITHWMPIPEFSTMQNLHKGGVIVNGFKLCTNCGKKRFMDSDRYHPIDDKGACHECQLKSEADND